MKRLIVAMVTGGAVLLPQTASAHPHNYYGDSARLVARYLDCKHFVSHGTGAFNLGSGVCYLRGKRVNIITFRGPDQQHDWNIGVTRSFGPGFYWGNGQGAVVVAKNGNRPVARLGARLLPGQVRHG